MTPVDEHQEKEAKPDLELVEGEVIHVEVSGRSTRELILKVKLQRAQGGCLGAWSRRRT